MGAAVMAGSTKDATSSTARARAIFSDGIFPEENPMPDAQSESGGGGVVGFTTKELFLMIRQDIAGLKADVDKELMGSNQRVTDLEREFQAFKLHAATDEGLKEAERYQKRKIDKLGIAVIASLLASALSILGPILLHK
ncbi:MAG: hypothetical protein ACRDQZ_19495 [Mycobacteriales bacterium]